MPMRRIVPGHRAQLPASANLDDELIDRLSRYEANLWRQAVQTAYLLSGR